MFEFIITNNHDLDILSKLKNRLSSLPKKIKVYSNDIADLKIIGLYFEDNMSSIAENEEEIILLKGSIYWRYFTKKTLVKVVAQDFISEGIVTGDIYKKHKGNFSIIKICKKTGDIKVINDHLGITPTYYGNFRSKNYITTSLSLLSSYQPNLDSDVILEKLLFNYSIGDEVLYKGIKVLNGGQVLTYSDNVFQVNNVFSLLQFVLQDKQKNFDYNELLDIFNFNVLQRTNNKRRVLASLTGGFDGRAVVSSLHNNNISFETYSYGKIGGENTEVPKMVANHLGFDHTPYYLEDDFEGNYNRIALDTIYYSDGNLSFENASTQYAFEKIGNIFDFTLTGLVAGEILGPIHLLTDYINHIYYSVVYENKTLDINSSLDDLGVTSFIKKSLINKSIDSTLTKIQKRKDKLNEILRSDRPHLVSIFDLMEVGFRRFYGYQMHLTRYFAENLPPFYDIDILALLFSTNYQEIYKSSLKSLWQRRKTRYTQAYIINKNWQELANLPVDRGFKPNQVLSLFKRPIIPFYYYKRKKNLKYSAPDFTSNLWAKLLLDKDFNMNLIDSPYFERDAIRKYINKINEDKNSYSWQKNKVISDFIFSHYTQI